MKFVNLSKDNEWELSQLEKCFIGVWDKQKTIWRYMPLIFTGPSWSGKDTVLNAVTSILEESFWVTVSSTRSRYLTRKQRPWEEDSPLNFISKEEFTQRDFSYSYDYSENLYGLDMDYLNTELQVWNISLVNGSPYSLQGLFDILFSQVIKWSLPPLIFFMCIDIDDNHRLLDKRWWNKNDTKKRKNSVSSSWDHVRYIQRFSRYKNYIKTISRSPKVNREENQHYFNHDVLVCLNIILNHIERYLETSHDEIIDERLQSWVKHIQNRP